MESVYACVRRTPFFTLQPGPRAILYFLHRDDPTKRYPAPHAHAYHAAY